MIINFHRVTMEKDAVEILKKCKEDNVDVAFLVPNCPICHQSVALIAVFYSLPSFPLSIHINNTYSI